MNKIAIATLVFAAAACGGDDAAKGTVNTTSAKTSVEQMGKINTSMSSGNGANAAAALQALTSASQSIVTPAGQAGRLVGLLPESFPRPDLSQAISGTAECSATSCTFSNYGDNTVGSSWLINGSVGKSGDTSTFDITYNVTSAGATIDWKIDGSVTINATTIDGNVHNHGVTDLAGGSNTQAIDVTWDTATDYNNITLDAQGCATGGDVHATVGYAVNTAGRGSSFNVQGGAKFGPACGTVTAN
jgi:hypothetical protein